MALGKEFSTKADYGRGVVFLDSMNALQRESGRSNDRTLKIGGTKTKFELNR